MPRRSSRPDTDRGLACPSCGSGELSVKETRPRRGGYTYRRRRCEGCGATFTTTERIISEPARRAA